MRRPSDIKELRSALGMWTYLLLFYQGYSIYASPLFNQLKGKNKELKWNDECEQAWKTMKEKIANAPVMGTINISKPLFMHTRRSIQ